MKQIFLALLNLPTFPPLMGLLTNNLVKAIPVLLVKTPTKAQKSKSIKLELL